MQLRPILLALGIMTVLLAGAMIPCALLDLADGSEDAHVFWFSAFVSGLVGGLVWVLARGGDNRIGQRETFLLTVSIWVLVPAVAAIPFIVSGIPVSDAMFEAVSGLTTTGATVLSGLDNMPRGLLLWRGVLNWIGGIGIIVTAIAILPQLRVGGMQLFSMESSDISGKFLPRVTDIAAYLGLTYLIISSACALSYSLSGMNWFDAIVHMMSTVSAGGFANYDASFGHENLRQAMPAAIFFMMVAGLPFSLLAMLILQGRIKPMLKDPQPRLYFMLLFGFSATIVVWHEAVVEPPIFNHIWHGATETWFNIVSVMTGTGYASAPYDTWGQPAIIIFLLATFMGGCAGSASCGMKMFRLEITAKALIAWSQRMVQPHRRTPVRYAGKPVDEETLQSVMVFMFLYLVTFMVVAALLSYSGLDSLSAISASATMVSNVGPGLGPDVGPSSNFAALTDFAKWVCTAAMLLGRLEFVAVFVVLTGRFWRG
ncbi:TrkH family potassium uptake protein [Hyphomonas sp. WL0036]|uniref:TrkH family potassium uptake protein n=1 Tax=Hyphomonas sediminis TaxID=2866160 RepID=UPI001C81AF7F|nr:TrkH family potassium uptake protein [Hyphomonas sediminis]MBY9066836.1 TrkH family potassium uptake protein [Hyphomonas sediminis]